MTFRCFQITENVKSISFMGKVYMQKDNNEKLTLPRFSVYSTLFSFRMFITSVDPVNMISDSLISRNGSHHQGYTYYLLSFVIQISAS